MIKRTLKDTGNYNKGVDIIIQIPYNKHRTGRINKQTGRNRGLTW